MSDSYYTQYIRSRATTVSIYRMRLWCVILFGWLSLLLCVHCGYVPSYGDDYIVYFATAGDGSSRFPDDDVTEFRNYFISKLNSDLIDGAVVTGSADNLYILNTTDLSLIVMYHWASNNVENCEVPDTSTQENTNFICRNHIRVYEGLPSNQSQILVCGTQAVSEPQCRILEIIDDDGDIRVKGYSSVPASPGLVSYYPQFSQFGQFRATNDEDSVFISAGFFDGDAGAGRHFSISYKNITTATNPNTLETTELYRTINANNNWLRFPVTFVGIERADYSSQYSPSQREGDYQFWFLIFRENLVIGDVVYSRVARICRNDPGSANPLDGSQYFTTFMKARIFCERHKPSSLEFTATLDYTYNSITSFVFSKGRYYSNSAPPNRLMYGAFTGPSNGPVGTALCVYSADNSVETNLGGRTKSVFDIFREDITSDLTDTPKENAFVECAPEGRPDDQQQLLFINPFVSIEQLGDDPILVLDNVIVTQMIQDTVCVVLKDDMTSCVNQDVLFLGLNSGRVLKVLFGTDEEGNIEPIIAEDIQLDDDDVREVTAMELNEIGGDKFLFVSTDTRVYKLPIHRCNQIPKCSCSQCVASRDPYCIYNIETSLCELNTLIESETVNERYRQNVHNGSTYESCDCPDVYISPDNILVNEGVGSVMIIISTTKPVSLLVETVDGTAKGGIDYKSLSVMIDLTPSSNETIVIDIIDDVAFEPNQTFTISLSSEVGVVYFGNPVTVTIQGNDGTNGVGFQVIFQSTLSCTDSLVIDDDFTFDLTTEIVDGIIRKCTDGCHDLTNEHIIERKLIVDCDMGAWSIIYEGELLSTETVLDITLFNALVDWGATRPEIIIRDIKLVAYCTSNTTCAPVTLKPSGLSSNNDNTYTAGEFAAVLVLFIIVLIAGVMLLLVILILLYRQKKIWPSKEASTPSPNKTTPTDTTDRPQPVKHSKSYDTSIIQQAQKDPCSSLQRLVPAKSEDSNLRSLDYDHTLHTVHEENTNHRQRLEFAGPDDDITTTSSPTKTTNDMTSSDSVLTKKEDINNSPIINNSTL